MRHTLAFVHIYFAIFGFVHVDFDFGLSLGQNRIGEFVHQVVQADFKIFIVQ